MTQMLNNSEAVVFSSDSCEFVPSKVLIRACHKLLAPESVCQQSCWIFAEFFPVLIAAASWQADMHLEMMHGGGGGVAQKSMKFVQIQIKLLNHIKWFLFTLWAFSSKVLRLNFLFLFCNFMHITDDAGGAALKLHVHVHILHHLEKTFCLFVDFWQNTIFIVYLYLWMNQSSYSLQRNRISPMAAVSDWASSQL